LAYEIQRRKRNGWTTMLRASSRREVEKGLHQLTLLDGHDFAWTDENVWAFIDDNPLTAPPASKEPRDDGGRWQDRWGFDHRQPAGTRMRLPRTAA
jgi:hypothetical protein